MCFTLSLILSQQRRDGSWIPAFAGMTEEVQEETSCRESEGVPQFPLPSPQIEDPPQEEWGQGG